MGSVQTPPLKAFAKAVSRSIALSRTIQAPSELKCEFSSNQFMRELHEAMVTKFLREMTGWSIAVEHSTSFKFKFSPQRCDRQNLNERSLHLFLQNDEIHYQACLLNLKVNIRGSRN